ncbi:monocarboxylate transporter 13-like [Branchiostoma floridae x Branchiostoma japonicum]
MANKRGADYSEAPDGGWGWFVVLSSFLSHVFMVGTFKSFGVFFPYLQEAFGQDAASTSWVSSIMGSVMLFGSLPAGALCNMFGGRAVVMTGSLLATTGLLSSMFVTSLAVMNLTAGFITGLGFSLMYTPCITMVGRYFKRRLSLANGIGISGSGVGAFVLPPTFQLLIDNYGWRGSLFIVAGIALQGCVFGAFLRPLQLKADIDIQETESTIESHVADEPMAMPQKTNHGLIARLCGVLDLSLLKMPYFAIFNIIMMSLVVGFSIPFAHLVNHARTLGLEPQQAAFLASVVGIADCLARIGYGWLYNLGLYPLLRGLAACSLGLGLSLMALPFAQTYPTMVVCCLFIGVFMGCLSTKTAVFLAEFCGVKRLASAVGIAFSVRGFSMLLSPPLAGYLYDVTGNYNVSFYVAGGMVLCSTVMTSALEAHRTRSVQRQDFDKLGSENSSRNPHSKDIVQDMDLDDSKDILLIRETSV